MYCIWINISNIGISIGLIILVISYFKIYKIHKGLNRMGGEEIVPPNVISNILNNSKLGLIGIILISFSGLIRIFLQ